MPSPIIAHNSVPVDPVNTSPIGRIETSAIAVARTALANGSRAGSVGDRQLAGSDVLDIRGIGGLGAPVGDGLKTRHLGVHRSGIGRYGGEIRSNLRFGIAREPNGLP